MSMGREFRDLLVDAARRGVQVRLLLDQIGCFGMRRSFFAPLIEAGGSSPGSTRSRSGATPAS